MRTDEDQIRDLIDAWLTATRAGDTQEVLNLMADDVVFLTPGQEPMRGRKAFAAAQSGLQDVHIDARGEVQEIRTFGDWAYAWTRLSVSMRPKRPGGQTSTRNGHTLSIFRRKGERWALYRDANLLEPPKA